jgi:single-strand DNA-binding protein
MNKAIFIGRLGGEPKFVGENQSVVNFSIATDDGYKDKNTGEYVNQAEWHQVVAFNKLAESVKKVGLSKGDMVYVSGKIKQNKWKDKLGMKHTGSQIHADEIKKVSEKTIHTASNNQGSSNEN